MIGVKERYGRVCPYRRLKRSQTPVYIIENGTATLLNGCPDDDCKCSENGLNCCEQ
jgi:hypothetical protein